MEQFDSSEEESSRVLEQQQRNDEQQCPSCAAELTETSVWMTTANETDCMGWSDQILYHNKAVTSMPMSSKHIHLLCFAKSAVCESGQLQIMLYIVNTFPITKFWTWLATTLRRKDTTQPAADYWTHRTERNEWNYLWSGLKRVSVIG